MTPDPNHPALLPITQAVMDRTEALLQATPSDVLDQAEALARQMYAAHGQEDAATLVHQARQDLEASVSPKASSESDPPPAATVEPADPQSSPVVIGLILWGFILLTIPFLVDLLNALAVDVRLR